MSSISILALHFQEAKKGLVLSGANQDALQALFGDDVTACFGKKVQFEPTPIRVAGRELGDHPAESCAEQQRGRAEGRDRGEERGSTPGLEHAGMRMRKGERRR